MYAGRQKLLAATRKERALFGLRVENLLARYQEAMQKLADDQNWEVRKVVIPGKYVRYRVRGYHREQYERTFIVKRRK